MQFIYTLHIRVSCTAMTPTYTDVVVSNSVENLI